MSRRLNSKTIINLLKNPSLATKVIATIIVITFASFAFVSGGKFLGYDSQVSPRSQEMDKAVGLGSRPVTEKKKTDSSKTTSTQQCNEASIPYDTVEERAIWLYKGQSEISSKGYVGKKRVCTDAQGRITETVLSKPVNEYKSVGTKEYPAPESPEPQISYEQALSLAKQTCQKKIPMGSWDSTDMGDCMNQEMYKYGY